jgi:broad specificity phosphatase PhoE
MRLILVRHGHYPLLDRALGGREGHALSAEGRAQAERAAKRLEGRSVAAVVTSPVQRAIETAAAIAAQVRVAPRQEPAFTEVDFAGWTGRRFAELASEPAWQAWNRFRSTAGVPGGETILAVQARAIAGVVMLGRQFAEREVVVVSHADVIKVIVSHVLGAPLDLMRRLQIAPGSMTEVEWATEDACLLCLNYAP